MEVAGVVCSVVPSVQSYRVEIVASVVCVTLQSSNVRREVVPVRE